MQARHYAQAFYDLVSTQDGEQATITRNFIAVVTRNGHVHLLPKIIKWVERIALRKEQEMTIEVTSASELSQTEVAALLKKEPYKNVLSSAHKKVVRKVDPNLIGGAIVRTSSSRVDGTHKQALRDLYQQLIST